MRLGSLIGVTGLILDIIGAWYLARGIVKKNLEGIIEEAPKHSFGINEAYVMGALIQKLEASIGFGFLFVGFMLQALSLVNTKPSSYNLSLWSITLDISVLIAFYIASHYIIKRKIRMIRKNYLRQEILKHIKTKGKPKHVADTKRYLGYLRIKFDDNISTEDAWSKLLVALSI